MIDHQHKEFQEVVWGKNVPILIFPKMRKSQQTILWRYMKMFENVGNFKWFGIKGGKN